MTTKKELQAEIDSLKELYKASQNEVVRTSKTIRAEALSELDKLAKEVYEMSESEKASMFKLEGFANGLASSMGHIQSLDRNIEHALDIEDMTLDEAALIRKWLMFANSNIKSVVQSKRDEAMMAEGASIRLASLIKNASTQK